MRPVPWVLAEPYRARLAPPYTSSPGDDYGSFIIPYPKTGQLLKVIANAANEFSEGWEHVSVSLPNRCPNWFEMSFVKDIFWLPEEAVMQLHAPQAEHINVHPNCLHLWRPTHTVIPRPPGTLV